MKDEDESRNFVLDYVKRNSLVPNFLDMWKWGYLSLLMLDLNLDLFFYNLLLAHTQKIKIVRSTRVCKLKYLIPC